MNVDSVIYLSAFVVLVALVVFMFLLLRSKTRQLVKLNEAMLITLGVLFNFGNDVYIALNIIRELDKRGEYEADDMSGEIFKSMVLSLETLGKSSSELLKKVDVEFDEEITNNFNIMINKLSNMEEKKVKTLVELNTRTSNKVTTSAYLSNILNKKATKSKQNADIEDEIND